MLPHKQHLCNCAHLELMHSVGVVSCSCCTGCPGGMSFSTTDRARATAAAPHFSDI